MPPVLKGSKKHKQGTDAITLIFVVVALTFSRTHRDRGTNLFDLLFAGFIHAHKWHFGIMGEFVDFKYIFHCGNKFSVGFGRDAPFPLLPRFYFVFLTHARQLCRNTAPYALAYIKGQCHCNDVLAPPDVSLTR